MEVLLALLISLTSPHVTELPMNEQHPTFLTDGYRMCVDGRAYLFFGEEADDWTRLFEYVGALDCVDDGRFNGSQVPGCNTAGYLAVSRQARAYDTALREHDRLYGTDYTDAYLASECASWTVTNYRWAADHNPGYACPAIIPERLCMEETKP